MITTKQMGDASKAISAILEGFPLDAKLAVLGSTAVFTIKSEASSEQAFEDAADHFVGVFAMAIGEMADMKERADEN